LSHTPHHTKSPLGSRGRDTVRVRDDIVENAESLTAYQHLPI